MQHEALPLPDTKFLAAKVLIVEDQIEESEGVPHPELVDRWRALFGRLRDKLCSGPTPRAFMRVPVGARITVRTRGALEPTSFFCEDISYGGCRVFGDISNLRIGDTVEFVRVSQSGYSVELATKGTVVWRKSDPSQPGEAGFRFSRPEGGEFTEYYQHVYKRFLNRLAASA